MARTWRVIPHTGNTWLIKTEKSSFRVSAEIGKLLEPLQGVWLGRLQMQTRLEKLVTGQGDGCVLTRQEADALANNLEDAVNAKASKKGSNRRALWLRVPLLPGVVVNRLAGMLRGLANRQLLILMAVLGVAGYVWGISQGGLRPVAMYCLFTPDTTRLALSAFGLFVFTAFWHELGHAVALKYEGLPPGGIGVGVLFIIPVLFADVTPMVLLPRPGKIRVDLAGVCFQVFAGGLIMACGHLLVSQFGIVQPAFHLAGLLAAGAVAWSLLPFIRSDGYWVVCDLLGIGRIEDSVLQQGKPVSVPMIIFLVIFRVINAVFLLFISLVLPVRAYVFFGKVAGLLGLAWAYQWQKTVVFCLLGVVLVMLWRRIVLRVWVLLKVSWVDLGCLLGNNVE